MSNAHKFKEGDYLVQTVETTNSAELLFFTNKCQVYKTKADSFDDTKISVMGDYVAAKLEMDEGESPVYMVVTDKNYKGYMMFFFENGKAAKVPLESYKTLTNRKKLIKAYSDKSPLVDILYLPEESEVVLVSSAGRHLLVNTAVLTPKTTKDTAGVNVLSVNAKKGQRLLKARLYVEGEFAKPYRFRAKNLPAAGALLSADDTSEQVTF